LHHRFLSLKNLKQFSHIWGIHSYGIVAVGSILSIPLPLLDRVGLLHLLPFSFAELKTHCLAGHGDVEG